MRARPPHLARVLAVLVALAVLLPGLATTAYAGEVAAPSAVSAVGGHRSVTVSFAPAGSGATYELLRNDAWVDLSTTPAGDGRLQATVGGFTDGQYVTPTVRADYGSYQSRPVMGSRVRTYYAPPSPAPDVYPEDKGVLVYQPRAMYPEDDPDGWTLVAKPAKRGLPTRSDSCLEVTGCRLLGLKNGKAYRLTVTSFNEYTVDGRTVRLSSEPRVVEKIVPSAGPQAPVDLRASGGDGVARLTWSQPPPAPGATVTDFQVRVGRTWRALPTSSEGGRDRTAEVSGLVDGRTYRIGVRGLAPSGKPGLPAFVTVTPEGVR